MSRTVTQKTGRGGMPSSPDQFFNRWYQKNKFKLLFCDANKLLTKHKISQSTLEASDLIQEAMVKVLSKDFETGLIKNFANEAHERSFIRKMMEGICRDTLKAHSRRKGREKDYSIKFFDDNTDTWLQGNLAKVLNSIHNEKARVAFEMYLHKYSKISIARKLKIRVTEAQRLILEACQDVKQYLQLVL